MTDAEIEELLAELRRLRKLDQVTRHCWCRHCRELRDHVKRLPDPSRPGPMHTSCATSIHDWEDARATAILANCRDALAGSGKVLVLERTIAPDYKEAVPVLQLDLQILVMLGGGAYRGGVQRALHRGGSPTKRRVPAR